eukprot:gnl/MRDRNA2_/MRDRNA2_36646_c0_seq2.p1 gnl/MRDRNA2_/MRDRNA2_36646_c0~~gnl/MRDRNA2_/MRDRNA2_36646_c0_seq2.p1  ORF type:complete len:299 (+),score=66.52 gnl/MRDRNA2_/MRDRNA2_36646_c0_seq2:81-977(+)
MSGYQKDSTVPVAEPHTQGAESSEDPTKATDVGGSTDAAVASNASAPAPDKSASGPSAGANEETKAVGPTSATGESGATGNAGDSKKDKPSTEKAVDEEKPGTKLGHSKRPRGAHPVWVAESQRFEISQGGWVPTAWIGDDPPPQQEILEYGDDGELKPLPVDIDVATKKDKDGNLMYGAVVDEDTDEDGWVYATKFENIDKPREGGRARHRLTDKVRRRLWYLGNVLVDPGGEVVERSWRKSFMQKVSGKIDDAKEAAKRRLPSSQAPKELVKRMREVILEPDEDFCIDDIMETGWG